MGGLDDSDEWCGDSKLRGAYFKVIVESDNVGVGAGDPLKNGDFVADLGVLKSI